MTYYQEHRAEIRAKQKIYHAGYYKRNKEQINTYNMDYRTRIKTEVLTHYSNGIPKCAVCDITDLDVLCIDHINNDGHEWNIRLRYHLLPWLRRNNYPEGYQVLCANCNLKKEIERGRHELAT